MSAQQDINASRAQRLANIHDPLALMANTQAPFHLDHSSLITYIQHPQPNNNIVPQSSFNTNYMQQPMQNLEDISDPTTALDMALELIAKAFQLNNIIPTNNNQRSSSNHRSSQTSQSGMNMGQHRHMLMVNDNNVGNQNGLSVISEIANQHRNGNVVAARAEGNARETRCCLSSEKDTNCSKGRSRDPTHFKGIFMAAVGACEEIERVNANCTLENNLQQASTSGTQSNKSLVYDSDGSTENNSNVIYDGADVEQSGGGTVDQNPTTTEEIRAHFELLYNNLATKVEKVNLVNRNLKRTNVDLTTELARYKSQEKCFEINQKKYEILKRGYQKSIYQEQCLTKKINTLHLSSAKQIMALNEEITNLNNQLSKEKSIVSRLEEDKKKLKSDFKTREDELLDKQIELEKKIKELDNILVKQGQSIQTMHMLITKPDSFYHTEQKMAVDKHDPPVVYDSEETLQLAQESRLKMKKLNKEIKPENYEKINKLSKVFVSQKAKSREEHLKFIRDFKYLAKEADESLAKHKALELEILGVRLEADVSQDIMSIVQNNSCCKINKLQPEA
ncbi:hypothetical protein Tco_0522755 [Tanacetum coccineum]